MQDAEGAQAQTTEARKAPGPKGGLFLGSALDFKESPLEFICYVQRAYGDVARFRVGHQHWYLISHPDDINDIMTKRAKVFLKPAIARRLWDKFLGDGLLTSEGDEWRRQLKLMRPAFAKKRVDAYGAVMVEYTQRMIDSWVDGARVDFSEAMVALTLEVVAKTLFDADVRGDAAIVGDAMHVLHEEMLNHIYMPLPVPRWWPSKGNRRKIKAITDIEEIVKGFIEERRASGEDRGDLLSTLILARTEEGEQLDDKEVRDQSMTLFFAGHETTAHAMTWLWYLLATHPGVTARLQRDLDAVTGGAPLRVDHLKALPYLDWVIKEGMRILPSVWVFMKEPIEATTVRGVRIPKGAPILISPYVTQHDARWFPSPETFDPERFSPERARAIPKGAYVPFSGGSRTCLGKGFAMMEAQLIVGTLVQRVKPTVPEGYVPEKQAVLSLQPLGGLPVDVVKRSAETREKESVQSPSPESTASEAPAACPMST